LKRLYNALIIAGAWHVGCLFSGSWPPEVGFASRRGRGGVFSSKTDDEGGLLDEGESMDAAKGFVV